MNLNEAIKKLKSENELCLEKCEGECGGYNYKDGKCYCADSIIVCALEEYIKIGTVEECREARERQRAKKRIKGKIFKSLGYYQCPICGGLLMRNEKFCSECGQAILQED